MNPIMTTFKNYVLTHIQPICFLY